jgi:hypothetical protein
VDVVYYCRPGPKNEELRYSLRSLANLEHDRVWIVGTMPPWVRNVEHIPARITPGGPQMTAADHLLRACDALDADSFVVFNDDFYLLQPVEAIPSLHAGPLAPKVAATHGSYGNALREAQRRLSVAGVSDAIAWTLHIPLVVMREALATVLRPILEGSSRIVRPEWRTMYGNLIGAAGEQAEDVKVRRRGDRIPDGPFLSSHDTAIGWLAPYLRQRFPKASPYEALA